MKKFVVIIFILIIVFSIHKITKKPDSLIIQEKPNPPVYKLQIINEDSKTRPFAVMYDNHNGAIPHSGLQDAYLVYEIVVEGGITRLLALFKDQYNDKPIGPIRSTRHYFLDYVIENDAILTFHGWSEQAKSDIVQYNINNVNGLYDNVFSRDTNKRSPHNSITTLNKVNNLAQKRNYTRDMDKDNLFKYSAKPISLNDQEDSVLANKVTIKYSNYMTTSYEYNEQKKAYNRVRSDEKHIDSQTGNQITVKNMIVIQVDNYTIDSKNRQDLKNIGTGKGYYISNGYAVPITWSKDSRFAQTKYKYLNGQDIILNDGNTFVQIQPINQKIIIE